MLKKIRNFFYWGWKLRGSYDWDNAFLYEIMYLKLKRMYEYFTSDKTVVDWEADPEYKQLAALKATVEATKRLFEDDYCKEEYEAHYEQYPILNLLDRTKRSDEAVTQFRSIMNQEAVAREADLELVANNFKDYSMSWWD